MNQGTEFRGSGYVLKKTAQGLELRRLRAYESTTGWVYSAVVLLMLGGMSILSWIAYTEAMLFLLAGVLILWLIFFFVGIFGLLGAQVWEAEEDSDCIRKKFSLLGVVFYSRVIQIDESSNLRRERSGFGFDVLYLDTHDNREQLMTSFEQEEIQLVSEAFAEALQVPYQY